MLYGDNHRLYHIWYDVHRRCEDVRRSDYERYGGRGISVCPEWSSYRPFREWALANGYKPGLSLDRRDNDGNYSPDNCRWATAKQQNNNKRSNHIIELNGQRHTMAEWAEITGIKYTTIRKRAREGWPAERILGRCGNDY